jgi:hypothetical protein
MFHVDAQTDGQTEMTKVIVAFRKSANSPKKEGINELKAERTSTQCMWKYIVLLSVT